MGDFIPLFVSIGDFVDTVVSVVLAGVITVVVVVVLFVGKLLVLFGEFFWEISPHFFSGYLDPPFLLFLCFFSVAVVVVVVDEA